MRYLLILVLVCGGGGLDAAPEASVEPVNLSRVKSAVRAYHDGGAYERDLARVAQEVIIWVRARKAGANVDERLAIVLDIDETVLSNYPHMDREDFGYNPPDWIAWVDQGAAPVIEEVKAVYDEARKLDVAIFFLTGRSDSAEKAGTLKNLKRAGMGDYEKIIFKGVEDTAPTAAERKRARREQIEAEGWTIIASVGDQVSDLVGGHTERGFKLPNPFYEIP